MKYSYLLTLCILFFAAIAHSQTTLYVNSVKTGLLSNTGDTQAWQINLPVSGQGTTIPTAISVFPLELASLIVNPYYAPTFAVTYSNVTGQSMGSQYALRTVLSPDQSFVIPQLNNQRGESIFVYITVQAMNISNPTNYTISASSVVDPMVPEYATATGVYSYQGRVSSGQRLYFSYSTYRESQIVVELCATNDNRTNNNAVPGAFLWNVYTDQMAIFSQQLADFPCGEGVPGTIFVKDPNTSNDSRYLKICPSVIYFSEGQPANSYFALDVLHFWQAPIVFGYYDFNIYIYTDQYITLSWQPTSNSVVVSPLSVSVADYPNIHIKFSPAYVVPSQNYTAFQYGIFSDSHLDVAQRQLTIENDLFSSACFLENNADTFLYQGKWYNYDELTQAGEYLVQITINNWTYPTQNYSGTPFHINVVAKSTDFGDMAYEYFTVTDNFAPTTPEIDHGLNGWEITAIILAVLVSVAVIIAVIGGTAVFVVKYKRSQYSQL